MVQHIQIHARCPWTSTASPSALTSGIVIGILEGNLGNVKELVLEYIQDDPTGHTESPNPSEAPSQAG